MRLLEEVTAVTNSTGWTADHRDHFRVCYGSWTGWGQRRRLPLER